MADKKYHWHKIAESPGELSFAENNIAVITVNNKKICIAPFQQQWFGFAFKCPHASGIMADGYIDAAGNVVCPVHRYKFNLQNGRNTSGEGYYLKTYPVEHRPDGLYVGMPESSFWG